MDPDLINRYNLRALNTTEIAQNAMEIELEEDEADSHLLRWRKIAHDADHCELLTGFNPSDFLKLFEIAKPYIPVHIGRGRSSTLTPHDHLLILLCYLKHYETYSQLKSTFDLSTTYLHDIIGESIRILSSVFYNQFVVLLDKGTRRAHSEDFPNEVLVGGVTFQPSWTPMLTSVEKKRWFSTKHGKYGIKSQCVHTESGLLVHTKSGIPGATDAFSGLQTVLPEITHLLEGETWIFTIDSGHQQHWKRFLLIFKDSNFSRGRILHSKEMDSVGAVYRNFYCRLKTMFRIMVDKYRGDRSEYDRIFRLCVALTNFVIIKRPL